MSDAKTADLQTKIGLVAECRESFGMTAARELWKELGLPGNGPDSVRVFPSQLADKFMVRLPTGYRARIKSLAATNGRSMNSEIALAIDRWLGLQESAAKGA